MPRRSNRPEHYPTPDADRLSRGQKLAYGIGGQTASLIPNSLFALANPVFNIVLGVRPDLVGLAFLLTRLWDAFTDPLMGYLSDNCNSRWGRRRPFVLVGAWLSGASFALIWMVPRDATAGESFGWFLGTLLLFYTCATVFQVSWEALGYEITPDYNERTRVQAYRAFFAKTGGLIAWSLPVVITMAVFADEIQAVRWVGVVVGAIIAIGGSIPAVFVKERPPPPRPPAPREPFLQTMRETLSNRPFLWLNAVFFLFTIGLFSSIGFSVYISVYHVMGGDQAAGFRVNSLWPVTVLLLGLFIIPPISGFATRVGKNRALLICLLFMVAGSIGSLWLYNPDHPWTIALFGLVVAPGHVALFMIIYAMVADVADVDELASGQRREASYGAVFNWVHKLGLGVSQYASGLLLNWTGFDALLGAAQSPDAVFKMRLLYAFLPAALTLAAIVCLYYYPLTEQRMHDVRERLERKRGVVHAAGAARRHRDRG